MELACSETFGYIGFSEVIDRLTIRLFILIFLLMVVPLDFVSSEELSLEKQLFKSVKVNHFDDVRKYIRLGANPFVENVDGLQAAEVAIDMGFFEIAHYLQAIQNQKRISQKSQKIENHKKLLLELKLVEKKVSNPKKSLDEVDSKIKSKIDLETKNRDELASPILNKNLPQENKSVKSDIKGGVQGEVYPIRMKNFQSKVEVPQQTSLVDTSEISGDTLNFKIIALPGIKYNLGKISAKNELREEYIDRANKLEVGREQDSDSLLTKFTSLFLKEDKKGISKPKEIANNSKKTQILESVNEVNETLEISETSNLGKNLVQGPNKIAVDDSTEEKYFNNNSVVDASSIKPSILDEISAYFNRKSRISAIVEGEKFEAERLASLTKRARVGEQEKQGEDQNIRISDTLSLNKIPLENLSVSTKGKIGLPKIHDGIKELVKLNQGNLEKGPEVVAPLNKAFNNSPKEDFGGKIILGEVETPQEFALLEYSNFDIEALPSASEIKLPKEGNQKNLTSNQDYEIANENGEKVPSLFNKLFSFFDEGKTIKVSNRNLINKKINLENLKFKSKVYSSINKIQENPEVTLLELSKSDTIGDVEKSVRPLKITELPMVSNLSESQVGTVELLGEGLPKVDKIILAKNTNESPSFLGQISNFLTPNLAKNKIIKAENTRGYKEIVKESLKTNKGHEFFRSSQEVALLEPKARDRLRDVQKNFDKGNVSHKNKEMKVLSDLDQKFLGQGLPEHLNVSQSSEVLEIEVPISSPEIIKKTFNQADLSIKTKVGIYQFEKMVKDDLIVKGVRKSLIPKSEALLSRPQAIDQLSLVKNNFENIDQKSQIPRSPASVDITDNITMTKLINNNKTNPKVSESPKLSERVSQPMKPTLEQDYVEIALQTELRNYELRRIGKGKLKNKKVRKSIVSSPEIASLDLGIKKQGDKIQENLDIGFQSVGKLKAPSLVDIDGRKFFRNKKYNERNTYYGVKSPQLAQPVIQKNGLETIKKMIDVSMETRMRNYELRRIEKGRLKNKQIRKSIDTDSQIASLDTQIKERLNKNEDSFDIVNTRVGSLKPPILVDIDDRKIFTDQNFDESLIFQGNEAPQIAQPVISSQAVNTMKKMVEVSMKGQIRNYNFSPAPRLRKLRVEPAGKTDLKATEVANLAKKVLNTNKEDHRLDRGKLNKRVLSYGMRVGDLIMGEDSRLGKRKPENKGQKNYCVDKTEKKLIEAFKSGLISGVEIEALGTLFCVETMRWNPKIIDAFGTGHFFSGGGRGVVHYHMGRAVQYHVLFPADSFLRISKYLMERYGDASENPRIWTYILGAPKRLNRTLRWRAPSANEDGYDILEIRSINDLRWSGLPQLEYGVVRLYREGAKPIFESVSISDLMMMQIHNNRAQPEIN